ncbi:citrate lyase holo-[acyl-carrier protein] synthase, partial [Klebsiella pneumoniae]
RRCMLCDGPAQSCVRSSRHDTDIVVARDEQITVA